MTDPLALPELVPNVLDATAVCVWLSELDGAPDIPLVVGHVAATIPDSTDRLGIVTHTGTGPGGLDGRGIVPRFQLRIRGRQGQQNQSDAERLAWQFDTAVRAWTPTWINGLRVLTVGWAASGPAALPGGSGRRPEHACTYLFTAIRPQ